MLFSHTSNDVQLIIVVYFLFLLLSFLSLAYAEIIFEVEYYNNDTRSDYVCIPPFVHVLF